MGGSSAEALLSTLGVMFSETSSFSPVARDVMIANVLTAYADQNEETLLFRKLPMVTRGMRTGPKLHYNGIYVLPLARTYKELTDYLDAELNHFKRIVGSADIWQLSTIQEGLLSLKKIMSKLHEASKGKSGMEQMIRIEDKIGQDIFYNWIVRKKVGDKLPVVGEIAYDTGVYTYVANGTPAVLTWQATDGNTVHGALRFAYEFSTEQVISSGDWRDMLKAENLPKGRKFPDRRDFGMAKMPEDVNKDLENKLPEIANRVLRILGLSQYVLDNFRDRLDPGEIRKDSSVMYNLYFSEEPDEKIQAAIYLALRCKDDYCAQDVALGDMHPKFLKQVFQGREQNELAEVALFTHVKSLVQAAGDVDKLIAEINTKPEIDAGLRPENVTTLIQRVQRSIRDVQMPEEDTEIVARYQKHEEAIDAYIRDAMPEKISEVTEKFFTTNGVLFKVILESRLDSQGETEYLFSLGYNAPGNIAVKASSGLIINRYLLGTDVDVANNFVNRLTDNSVWFLNIAVNEGRVNASLSELLKVAKQEKEHGTIRSCYGEELIGFETLIDQELKSVAHSRHEAFVTALKALNHLIEDGESFRQVASALKSLVDNDLKGREYPEVLWKSTIPILVPVIRDIGEITVITQRAIREDKWRMGAGNVKADIERERKGLLAAKPSTEQSEIELWQSVAEASPELAGIKELSGQVVDIEISKRYIGSGDIFGFYIVTGFLEKVIVGPGVDGDAIDVILEMRKQEPISFMISRHNGQWCMVGNDHPTALSIVSKATSYRNLTPDDGFKNELIQFINQLTQDQRRRLGRSVEVALGYLNIADQQTNLSNMNLEYFMIREKLFISQKPTMSLETLVYSYLSDSGVVNPETALRASYGDTMNALQFRGINAKLFMEGIGTFLKDTKKALELITQVDRDDSGMAEMSKDEITAGYKKHEEATDSFIKKAYVPVPEEIMERYQKHEETIDNFIKRAFEPVFKVNVSVDTDKGHKAIENRECYLVNMDQLIDDTSISEKKRLAVRSIPLNIEAKAINGVTGEEYKFNCALRGDRLLVILVKSEDFNKIKAMDKDSRIILPSSVMPDIDIANRDYAQKDDAFNDDFGMEEMQEVPVMTGDVESGIHLDGKLPPLSFDSDKQEKEMRKTLNNLLEQAFAASAQNLFDGKPAMISLPVNSEVSGVSIEELSEYMREVQGVRVEADKKSVEFNVGKITYYIFEDNPAGHNKLLSKLDGKQTKWNVTDNEMARRSIVYSFAKEIPGITDKAFTVYLEGEIEKGKYRTPTPLAKCIAAGIKVFNLFDLTRPDRKGVDANDIKLAREDAVRGILSISGLSLSQMKDLTDDLIEKVKKVGLFALSGKLFIKIRPVNWNDMIRLHKMEREVLRAV